ncbi:MAG: dihydropteridine reductase [Clostridiales bacterium]|nr:dihydropteridine reductase [Clostridiales bacterium]
MTNKNEKQVAEKIKSYYSEKSTEKTKLDELKELDKKVKNPAKVVAYTYGSIGTLVLGTGMSLAMKIIGASVAALMPIGIVIGLIGIGMVSSAYPMFHAILSKRKAKYSKEIIAKSNELLND